jgi:hypothetical protein
MAVQWPAAGLSPHSPGCNGNRGITYRHREALPAVRPGARTPPGPGPARRSSFWLRAGARLSLSTPITVIPVLRILDFCPIPGRNLCTASLPGTMGGWTAS